MSGPPPPRDQELKNIIDKLANFVARNGVEFERMTKQKQKENPKFQFLFGGDYYDYYSYRVSAEQTLHQQQQMQPPPFQQSHNNGPPPFPPHAQPHRAGPHPPPQNGAPQPPPFHPPPMHGQMPPNPPPGHGGHPSFPMHNQPPPHQMPPLRPLNSQQPPNIRPPPPLTPTSGANSGWNGPPVEFFQQQIQTSLSNLQAQQQVLGEEQEAKIRQVIEHKVTETLESMSRQMQIDVSEIDRIVSPIVDSCTKDAISAGKQCFLNVSANSASHCNFLSLYLLDHVLNKVKNFDGRLHIIYLINDVVHHCFRKGNKDLQDAVEDVVVPIFILAQADAQQDNEKFQKLNKLVTLWATHKYFHQSILDKLRQLNTLKWSEFTCKHVDAFKDEIQGIQASTQARIIALTQQHDSFVAHLEQQMAKASSANASPMPQPPTHFTNAGGHQQPPHMPPFPPPPGANMPPPHPDMFINGAAAHQNSYKTFQPRNINGQPVPDQNSEDNMPPFLPNAKFFDYEHKSENVPPHLRAPGDDQLPEFKHEVYEYDHGNSRPLDDPLAKNRFPVSKEPPIESLIPTAPYWDLPAGLMVPLINLKDVDYEPIDPNDMRLPPAIPPSNRLLAAVDAFYAPPTSDKPRNVEGWEQGALYEYYKAKSKYIEKRFPPKAIKIPSYVEALLKTQVIDLPPHKPRLPLSRHRRPSPANLQTSRSSRRKRSASRSRSRSRSRSNSRSRSSSSSSGGSPRGPTSALPLRVTRRSEESKLEESNVGHQLLKKMGWGGQGLGREEQGIQEPIKPKTSLPVITNTTPLFRGHVPAPGLSTVVPPKSEKVTPIPTSNLDPEVAKRLEDKRAEFQRKAAELLMKAKPVDS